MSNAEFRIVPGYFGPRVAGKFAGLRKERTFSVSPGSDGSIYVQADGVCGKFDPATGKGVFNSKGEYFVHLSRLAGARDFEFPEDFVTLCNEVCPEPGGETTRGGVTLVNTIEVIGG